MDTCNSLEKHQLQAGSTIKKLLSTLGVLRHLLPGFFLKQIAAV
jgi:hypothetical protein